MSKIFIESSLVSKESQGSLTYLRELYKLITLNGKSNTFIFGTYDSDIIEQMFGTADNVCCYKYVFRNKFFRLFIETPFILWKKKINCAHFQYITPFYKPRDCKYIVTIHDVLFMDYKQDFTLLYRVIRTFLFFISAKVSDLILTVSDYSRERIASHFSIALSKIKLTPNGISDDFVNFKATKEQSKKHVKAFKVENNFVLYVSRVEARKNQLLLLDFFEETIVTDKSFTVVFVGSASHETGFISRFYVLKKAYPDNVFYFETLKFKDLLHFYNSAQLFIYPSKCEGFGIPPLEAAVLGTPVLCSNLTAMADFDFFNPWMFDPLTDKIIDSYKVLILQHDSAYQRRIRKIILEKYDWNIGASLLLNYFNKL